MIVARIAIFLSMMLSSGLAHASGFQLGFGGLTAHYGVGPGYHNYCEQLGTSNVIYNRTYYGRVEGKRDALTYIIGFDSICSPIQGLFYTYKIYEGNWFGFGFTVGGYRFNMSNWIYEENNAPANKYSVFPVYTKVGSSYFVPVAAAEFNFALVHAGTWGLWINALVAPIITNVSVSLKKTF